MPGGLRIETEWRSDWKWERVETYIGLAGHRVLDIGCGNGYFGLRMLGAGAALVVGIDPTLLFVMQWLACRHFSGDIANYVLPLAIEDLPADPTRRLSNPDRACLATGGGLCRTRDWPSFLPIGPAVHHRESR